MGSFLPLCHPGSWAYSMADTHVKLRNGKQCHSAAYCMCVVLCCISATQLDVFCHSVLLSVIFYDHDQQHCYHQARMVNQRLQLQLLWLLMFGTRMPETC